ncbi:MAG: hypothetical protein K9G39_10890, partial [Chlorobium sp.]|uniref:hypothetical protein n=1 Tax=Chlorobium sp. TaxID=1095 RepID=UPI0025B9B1EF
MDSGLAGDGGCTRVCRRVVTRRYRYAAPMGLEEVGVAGCVYRYGTPTGFEEKMKMVCWCPPQPRRGGMSVERCIHHQIWVVRMCRRVDTRRYRYVAPPELEEVGEPGSATDMAPLRGLKIR